MRRFILQAETRGIQLSAHGDRLDVRAPKGTLTPEIVSYMKKNKASLMRVLSSEPMQPNPALPKSVYACLDYLRRTKFEKPLTEKLQAWLGRDPAVARYEAWLK